MSRPDESRPPVVTDGENQPVAAAAPPDNFESALERLESLVSRMEGERLPLEELLACYEQGTQLLQTCGDFLQSAEQRIELIARGENGQPQLVDFPAASSSAAAAENQLADAQPANPTQTKAGAKPGATATGSSRHPSPNRKNHEVSLF